MRDFNCDNGRILKHEVTPEGYLRVYARVAKVGELEYQNLDGSKRIEVVTRDVLFNKDSINSLKTIPVTLGHPTERVTSINATKYSKGLTTPYVIIDGDYLGVVTTLIDAETIAAVQNGDAVELSCGYDAEKEVQSDSKVLQLTRKYNHISVEPRGRAGRDVKFQLDAEDTWTQSTELNYDAESIQFELNKFFTQDALTVQLNPQSTQKNMYTFTLDGIEFQTDNLDLSKHAKSVDVALVAAKTDLAALNADKAVLTAECDKLKGQIEATQKQLDDLLAEESKQNTDAIGSEIALRLETWQKVLPVLIKDKADFKPDYKLAVSEIQKLGLTKLGFNCDGKSSDHIAGMFDASNFETRQTSNVDSILDVIGNARQNTQNQTTNSDTKRNERKARIEANGVLK